MSSTIAPLDAEPCRGSESTGPLPEADAQALEERISGLAVHIARFTCQFLELLAEFDRAGGWHDRGFVSASQWLSWRCGMTETTAREHMRVARALPALPLIAAEFRTGHLSYSKVRALTRVATAQTEPELVQIARGASASQLERFIAGLRAAGELQEVERVQSRRRVTWRVADDGEVHLTARLSPEDGAVVIDALQATQEYLMQTGPGGTGGDEPGEDDADEAQQRTLADALVQICAEGPLTEACEPAPASRRAETVVHATLDQLAQIGPSPGGGAPRLELGPALHPQTARRLTCDTGVVLHLHDDDDSYTVLPSSHPGRTIDVGRRTRTPNASLMQALWDRDRGCRFPCCGRRRFVHAHHVVHWAHGGPTTLDNLVLLCGQHHRLLHEGGFTISLRQGQVRVIGADGRPVPAEADRPWTPLLDTAAADAMAGGVRADAEALSPVNGGPMHLTWAVGVVADSWAARRAQAAATAGDPGAEHQAPNPDAAA